MEGRHQSLLLEVVELATADHALQPMLQRVADLLRQRLAVDLVALVSVDLAARCYHCDALSCALPCRIAVGYRQPLGTGVVGEVAASGKPRLVSEARGTSDFVEVIDGARAEICVPLIHQGQVVAVLNAESRTPGSFDAMLPLFLRIAGLLAPMVAAARVIAALEQRTWLYRTTGALTREVLGETDLNRMLAKVLASLVERLDLCYATIAMREIGGEGFVFAAEQGASLLPPGAAERFRFDRGIVHRALVSRQPQWVPEVEGDPDHIRACAATRAEYVVPLLFRGTLLGALNLESADPACLGPSERELVDNFAHDLAAILHLARIHHDLESQRRLAEAHAAALAEANGKLQRLSEQDGLTGIANRRRFDAELKREWARAQRHPGTALGLIMLDVDHFKALNDAYGHLRGDDCLRQIAGCIDASLKRADEFCARFGGEEFAVLLAPCDLPRLQRTAEYLREAVEALGLPHPTRLVTTISAGAALCVAEPERQAETLIARADAALYRAKAAGRNRAVVLDAVAPVDTSEAN